MITYYLSIVETEEDRQKVTHIYTEYYSFMCRVAAKYLNNLSDIEDIVHDSMLKLIDRLDTLDFSEEIKLRSYIGVVVKHRAIDLVRQKKNNTEPLDELFPVIDDDPTPEETVVGEESYEYILRTIRELEDKYKNVCILKYVHQLKEKDIAELLGISDNVVAVRLHRARKMLRESLAGVR